MEKRRTVGLALGSGGVRGLAHVGVIKTLLKHGIPIDYLAGASIGAWVGAHYALFLDIEKTTDFTVGKKKEKMLSFLEPTMSGGLVKGEKIEVLLEDWFNSSSFSDLKIPLKIVTTDIVSGDKIIFSEGNLAKAVRASMAVPGFFKPVVLDERALVDGGLSDPVPVDLIKEFKADIIIAVNLDNFQSFAKSSLDNVGFGNVASGTIEITRHHLAQLSCQGADFIIQPLLRDYSSWKDYFMGHNNDEEIIKIAEDETEKIIPALKLKLAGKNI